MADYPGSEQGPRGGGGGSLPPIVFPPGAKGDKSRSQWQAFNRWLKTFPGGKMHQWAELIWTWGREYHVPPAILASLIYTESHGVNNQTSKDGAMGLGQLWHKVGLVTSDGFKLTDAMNPNQNIRFTAYWLRKMYEEHGSTWKSAYMNGYNPNDSGNVGFLPWLAKANKFLGKYGSAPPGGPSPDEKNKDTQQLQANQDPWVVIDPKTKKLKFVTTVEPPKNAVKSFGLPVTRSQFMSAWRTHFDPIFQSYIGRSAKANEVANLLRTGRSDYQLTQALSKNPLFQKSQLWKSRAPQYESVAKDIYGGLYKVKKELIRQAIVHNWSGESLAEMLRKLPEYQTSNEYQAKALRVASVLGLVTGNLPTTGSPYQGQQPQGTKPATPPASGGGPGTPGSPGGNTPAPPGNKPKPPPKKKPKKPNPANTPGKEVSYG